MLRSPVKTAIAAAVAMALSPITNAQIVLEEVIVTAQKRAESLQDVPISVSAVQGDKINSAGMANMAALADYVPNFLVTDGPVNTNIYLRGVGSSDNQAFEQSVAMLIDGIYMGRGRQYRSPFMDIERVEVLRGPQGTLFGKNTVAGAVNVITASPDVDEPLNGYVNGSVESNDGLIGEAVLSGAVTDTFALRGAIKYRENEGYLDNEFLNNDEPEIEETVYRLTAVWQPSDDWDVNFKYAHSDYEKTGSQSGTHFYLPENERDALIPNRTVFTETLYQMLDQFYPQYGESAEREFTTFKDNGYGPGGLGSGIGLGMTPDSSDNETDTVALNVDFYAGDFTVTSITGWSAYEFVDGCDCDWTPVQFIARDDDQEFDQFSQEFRIASPTGGFIEYIAGAYYEQTEMNIDRRVTIDTSFGGLYEEATGINSVLTSESGGLYTANQTARNHTYDLDTDAWALFAQSTFNLSERLRLTLGLRYTEETKEVRSTQFLSDDLQGIDHPNDAWILGFLQATEFDTYAYDYDEDRDTDQWIPSANFQWDVGDDHMLYFSWSEGFKSGGFTAADDGAPGDLGSREFPCDPAAPVSECYDQTKPSDDFEFDDEEVIAWEIGGKHTLLDGAMTANWAAFYTEYDNLQTSIFRGISYAVTNAAEVEVSGVEFDLLWQATQDLRLGLNGAWLDSEYKSYPDAPCTALQLDVDLLCGQPGGTTSNDVSGKNTTFAPEYTAAVFFDYARPIGASLEFFAGGEANYSDEFDTQADLDPLERSEDYTKINLRLGLRSLDQGWEAMVYGRNITDEEVRSYGFDVPVLAGSHGAIFDEGEIYGARLQYVF